MIDTCPHLPRKYVYFALHRVHEDEAYLSHNSRPHKRNNLKRFTVTRDSSLVVNTFFTVWTIGKNLDSQKSLTLSTKQTWRTKLVCCPYWHGSHVPCPSITYIMDQKLNKISKNSNIILFEKLLVLNYPAKYNTAENEILQRKKKES